MTNYPETGRLSAAAEKRLLIKNVRPYGEGEPVQVLISDGVIADMGVDLESSAQFDETIDAEGNVLLPGLVDMHVHLREPGREDTETIETGSRAAAKGGFTAVFTMANTNPVIRHRTGLAAAASAEAFERGERMPTEVDPQRGY